MQGERRTLTEEQIKALMQNAEIGMVGSRHYLSIDPAIPSIDVPINQIKLQQWVQMHEPKFLQMAQKLANSIRYIDFSQFYRALQQCAATLNEAYVKMGVKDDQVVIAVPFLSQAKSNAWVTSLLLPMLIFKPLKITEALETRKIRELLKANPQVKRIIVADDASYSGVDLSFALERLKQDCVDITQSQATIDIITPFITNKAKSELSKHGQVFYQEIMPTLDELPFTEEERFLLDCANVSGSDAGNIMINRLTPTYFAHKMADAYSVPEKILKEGLLISSMLTNRQLMMIRNKAVKEPSNFSRMHCQFIPPVHACYKEQEPKMHLSDMRKKAISKP